MAVPEREKRQYRGSEWSKKIEYNFPVLKACISVLKESAKCRAQMNEKKAHIRIQYCKTSEHQVERKKLEKPLKITNQIQ